MLIPADSVPRGGFSWCLKPKPLWRISTQKHGRWCEIWDWAWILQELWLNQKLENSRKTARKTNIPTGSLVCGEQELTMTSKKYYEYYKKDKHRNVGVLNTKTVHFKAVQTQHKLSFYNSTCQLTLLHNVGVRFYQTHIYYLTGVKVQLEVWLGARKRKEEAEDEWEMSKGA